MRFQAPGVHLVFGQRRFAAAGGTGGAAAATWHWAPRTGRGRLLGAPPAPRRRFRPVRRLLTPLQRLFRSDLSHGQEEAQAQ